MQLIVQGLQASWHAVLGSALIIAGIVLAAQTLAVSRGSRRNATRILRAYQAAEWSQGQFTYERTRPMDLAVQQARVAAIAAKGLLQIETVANLHGRAMDELEAVDEALIGLLAQLTPAELASIRQLQADEAAEPAAEPLAA